jgi:hypothetical protein
MKRDMYKAVTIQILIPAPSSEKEGDAYSNQARVPVRRFTDNDLTGSTWKQVSGGQQQRILNYVEALRAIEAKDQLALEKAYMGLKAHAGAITRNVTQILLREPGAAQVMLANELSGQLEEVRLILWYWKEQMVPALLCPDVATAFLLHVFMSATGASAGVRLCPRCGHVFLQKRRDQDYCSIKCREAHRVARFRAEQAAAKHVVRQFSRFRKRKSSINRSKDQ